MTNLMLKKNLISSDDVEIYEYGLELLQLKIIHMSFILLIGLCLGYLLEVIVFILSFFTLRANIKGYHAKTRIACIIISIMIALTEVLLLKFTNSYLNPIILSSIVLGLSTYYLLVRNQESSFKERLIVVIGHLIAFVLCYFLVQNGLMISITYSFIVTTILSFNIVVNQ